MKIKKNKEENINEESKNVLKDFSRKKILMNILYHKIFLGMCVLVNIRLFIFIIIYNNQLKEIESITNIYTTEFSKSGKFLNDQRSSIDHKIVNLISINRRKTNLFAYSFLNKIEFEMVQNFIIEYYRNNPLQYDENIFENYKLQLIYQSSSFDNSFLDYAYILNYHRNTLFIIHTTDNIRFGIYVDEPIIFSRNKDFVSNENRMFIFSFQSKSMHKYIGKGPSLKINKHKILEIGNEEIVIYENFYNNGGYIDYPLESFEGLNEHDNIFTQINGKFDIKNIEIFSFYLDKNRLPNW